MAAPTTDVTVRLRKLKTRLANEAADTILRLRHELLATRERAEAAEKRAARGSLIQRAEGGKGLG